MGKRGMKPKLYDFHGSRMSVKRFAEALNIPLSTAYWHLQKCGGGHGGCLRPRGTHPHATGGTENHENHRRRLTCAAYPWSRQRIIRKASA